RGARRPAALRAHPRAGGPAPGGGTARLAGRGRAHPHPHRAQERPVQTVPEAVRARGRAAHDREGRAQGDRPEGDQAGHGRPRPPRHSRRNDDRHHVRLAESRRRARGRHHGRVRLRRAAATARHGARAPEERSLTAPAPDPRFIGSFPRADAPLSPALPEVALIGRSNVGKSSLLNALAGRRIAKISGTPGKTRALNVFLIPGPLTPLYFLDLPGYGYARAGKAQRAAFRGLVKHALRRERLRGVVWLLDIRHALSADDQAMQDALADEAT